MLLGDEVRVPKQSNDYVIHLSSTELQPIGSVKCSCSSWRRLFSYLSTSFFFVPESLSFLRGMQGSIPLDIFGD